VRVKIRARNLGAASPCLQALNAVDMAKPMEILVYIGTVLTLAGLGLLGFCIYRARQIQRDDLPQAELQKLVAFNLGGLALSAIGLMCVMLGLLL